MSSENAYFVAGKARQFDTTDPEMGFDAGGDGTCPFLGGENDRVPIELTTCIHDLDEEGQIDLVALTSLGRGDADIDNRAERRAESARAHNEQTAAYLLGIPMLADHLKEALSKLGHSLEKAGKPVLTGEPSSQGNTCLTAQISIFPHRSAIIFRRMRRTSIALRSTMPSQLTLATLGRKKSLIASLGPQSSAAMPRKAITGCQ